LTTVHADVSGIVGMYQSGTRAEGIVKSPSGGEAQAGEDRSRMARRRGRVMGSAS
jgi:hypothetical protein